MQYEYKVVPAPTKPRKGPRIKGAEAKFAHGVETTMNEYAADGWEYLRADILPSEERRGFRSAQTVYRTVLVFRRAVSVQAQPGLGDVAMTAVEEAPQPQPEPQTEPLSEMPKDHQTAPQPAEDVYETERRARFSLVGPARRADDARDERRAPPLTAPHVRSEAQGDDPTGPDGQR